MSKKLWKAQIPIELQNTAQKVCDFLVLEKNVDRLAAEELLNSFSRRAWLIEQHNKLAMGRSLTDNTPFDVMLHDAANSLLSAELLAYEVIEINKRRANKA